MSKCADYTYLSYVSGFSSKYSGYSFQDDSTKLIIHFELVQVKKMHNCIVIKEILCYVSVLSDKK